MKRHLFLKKTCALAALLSCGHLGFAQLSGAVSVGAGQTYTSLTGAGGLFSAINTSGMSGNVTVTITSDLSEDGTVALTDFTSGGTNNYRLTIVPDGTTVRSITNTGSLAAMVKLSGASNVKIDGSIDGAGRYLRFSNTTTTTTANTIQLAGTASVACSNDTIKNCIIEGTNTDSLQTLSGAVIGLIATGTANGVTNTAILNNLISSPNTYLNTATSGTMPSAGIVSATGTTAAVTNSNILINNNEFANCKYSSVVQSTSVSGTAPNNFTISNNSIYFTVPPPATSTLRMMVYIRNGQGHTIANNWVGGSAPQTAGSALGFASSNTGAFYGIYLTGSATSLVNITGNTVANIAVPTSTFTGIYISASAVGNVNGNTVQKASTISSGTAYGIYSAANNTVITNNVVGGSGSNGISSAGITAIGIYGSGSKDTISGNTIRNISSTTSNSSSTDANGIYMTGSSPYIYNNTIDSIIGNNTSNSGNQAVLGINIASGAVTGTPSIVAKNNITNIINTNTAGVTAFANSVSGISILNATAPAPIKFDGNYIAKIYGYNNTAGNNITGILENNNATAGSDTFINNVIILDSAKVANGWIKCLHASAGASSITLYNNTFVVGSGISLNANNNAGKGGAHCLTTNTNIKFYLYNNILSNQSSNTGTAQPFAFMSLSATVPSLTSMVSNYNLVYTNDTSKLFGNGTASILNYNLGSWKGIVSDIYSTVASAPFVSLLDGHIVTSDVKAWNVYGRGMASVLVSTDRDGNTRSTIVGIPVTVGAYEIAMPTAAATTTTMIPAIPVAGIPSSFYTNGRKVAEINWGLTSTVPSSITATYYPGVSVPGSPNSVNVNSYFDVQQTGFSGTYTIKLYTNTAEANGIDFAAMGAIKKHDGDVNFTTIANAGSNASDLDGNYIQSNTLTNFSVFGLTNPSTPLAITWNKVNATLNLMNEAVISWSVSENEVAAYDVQKSTDGAAFETIATVKSKGNGNNSYSFTEAETLNGKAWYRIAQHSVSNNVNYSTVMMLNNNMTNTRISIYPNPATQVLNIEASQTGTVYTIFDLQGKAVKSGALQQGKNVLNVSNLAKGIYTIKAGDTNQKVVLQ